MHARLLGLAGLVAYCAGVAYCHFVILGNMQPKTDVAVIRPVDDERSDYPLALPCLQS